MGKKERLIIYLVFSAVYLLIALFSFMNGSKWVIDNITALVFLTFMFLIKDKISLGKFGFLLFNFALLFHNLGSFGFYGWSFSIIAYDTLSHLIGSLAASYIIFNWFTKLIPHGKNEKLDLIRNNRLVLLFVIIGCVTFLSLIIEFIEFGGFIFFEPGEGMYLAGIGDSGSGDDPIGQYTDTMGDIFMNVVGSVLGFLLYLHKRFFRKILDYKP